MYSHLWSEQIEMIKLIWFEKSFVRMVLFRLDRKYYTLSYAIAPDFFWFEKQTFIFRWDNNKCNQVKLKFIYFLLKKGNLYTQFYNKLLRKLTQV